MGFLARRCILAVCLLLAAGVPAAAREQDGLRLGEQEIKAGLLYNFLKYTVWPQVAFAQDAAITVCLFGGDPLGGRLKPMAGRTVNQRPIMLRDVSGPEEMAGCHLLFINAAQERQWPQLRAALSGRSVLTVSDLSGFAAGGGMIELGDKDNRIVALLNMEATGAAGLRIEDRMLKLVTVLPRTQENTP